MLNGYRHSNLLEEKEEVSSNFLFMDSLVFSESLILEILRGNILGCKFKNLIDKNACDRITSRFWNSSQLKSREDKIADYQIGAFHYNKTMEEYFSEVNSQSNLINNVLAKDKYIINSLFEKLEVYLGNLGIVFRRATFNGNQAGEYTIRSASPTECDVIKAHEDLAQCHSYLQNSFEIQKVTNYRILGANICLENENKGKLRCWNFKPNSDTRKKLGLEGTGYPYPTRLLNHYPCLDISVDIGDMYFFDAGNVHSVFSDPGAQGSRTTLSFFLGFIDEKTVVYWS